METLLERFLPQLRAFVRSRMSALLRAQESESDLVQSACRELFAKGDAFEYQGEQAFRSWLFTAVLQKLLAKERNLRREKRDPRRQVPLDGGAASGDGGLARAWSEALDREQPVGE